ncbi:toxin-antitoxin system TumE family protein [Cupriavidus alkaliphilus]|uniref:Uncharacterized protein n=1 Tax=Cupriavidus alkaliphilus TaxID=942866 RepID=A0A7W4VA33_9BURK|nr:DUF6516 family protein [Cupriavidus alkaliphilus]MBB3007851.1 hypothetical protein [Cupriavidus alkaliphilus]PVY70913.1 hypothetical protein C7414_11272 [Cupriavidus alkaliphilus]SCB30854.1 hypothetical protein GA0116996_111143 [Cupriavidus alkaliphilus]
MRDRSLDTLLDLDGLRFVIDDESLHWVKIVVRTCPVSQERPHGLRYSLTLHDRMGCRLLGFDNAHGINEGSRPGARTRIEYDHKHLAAGVRFYDYQDASTLLEDFWTEVDKILQQKE